MILLQLLILILRDHLQDPSAQSPPEGFKYAYHEVIIPRKLTPRYGQQELHYVNYWLQIEGKDNLIHLRQKKGIIPRHFPIFTYNREGNLQVDYPFIQDDCYYHGFVQNKSSSLAALTTCSGGLRGILRLDNKTYEILPIQQSATFQHVVYRLEHKEDAVTMSCGLTEEERRRQEAMMHNRKGTSKIHSRQGWWPHIRYVKNAVVVEHGLYLQFLRNETLLAMRMMEIIHLSNSFYLPLAIDLSLAGLELWSEKNLIQITGNITDVLVKFNMWRRNTLVNRLPNDAGHLIAYKSFRPVVGLAFLETICNNNLASAVESYRTSSLFYISNTFTHELGHILGMKHDRGYCTCGLHACIMADFQAETDRFSNCSYADYFKLRNRHCLLIPPDPDKVYKHKYCGNKIVDQGEQCDCGSRRDCESNPCCQINCMFHPGASCALGMCCNNCSCLPAGTICRKEKSTCDLPEYCNGSSEFCPKDFYVQNGAPCKDGTYCYNGSCSTHYDQCQEIFGRKAAVASADCFRKVNIQGDRFGNCGLKHGIYKKCSAKNSLCGRIQCNNIDHLLEDEHRTVIQTPIGNKNCWGVEFHSGMNLSDSGEVNDGTPCGIDLMCINGECTSISLLNYDCNATKCHNRGKCNNLKHCHCDFGWAPPDCQKKGNGGSIDSGPPPARPPASGIGAVKTVIIVFLLFGAVLLAGIAVHYRNKLKECLKIT